MSITAIIIIVVLIIVIIGVVRAYLRSDTDSNFFWDMFFLDVMGDLIEALIIAIGDALSDIDFDD